ncbi:MAG: universal stress protein [Thermoplasmatota archaeon]
MGHKSLDEVVKNLKNQGESILSEVKALAEDIGVELETHTFQGRVYEKICELAEKEDIIYISSHGRSGISSYLLGSTTERVLKHAKADVVVVKTKSD